VTPVGVHGSLLGVLDRPALADAVVELGAGDVVVFYTDGVPEGRRGAEFYGEERLAERVRALRGQGAEAVAQGIVDDVVSFQGGLPRDDIALVVVGVPEVRR
jgi:phosphoserine phosphatase RsbU/P